jgi:hypothetical protein
MAQRGGATPLASIRCWAYGRKGPLSAFAAAARPLLDATALRLVVGAPSNRWVFGTPFAGRPGVGS